MYKFAVISFPGTNCENEAVRAFKRNEMEAEVVLWNDPEMLEGKRLNEFAGYCIAGGFSYEDRGRSGVIAAQDPITEILKQEADKGKIILGICNGAQILVETGLIPGYENKALGMALTWNIMKKQEEILDTGYYCTWTYLKNTSPIKRTAFNNFDELLNIPIAHGEGRFIIEAELLKKLEGNGQIVFRYSDTNGQVNPSYPITPNGSISAIAAISNPAGNVMAIMPHPERDPIGNGNLIFKSIRQYLEKQEKASYSSLGVGQIKDNIKKKESFDLEFYIRFIITDNTERTIEETFIRKGLSLHLERYEFYGVRLDSEANPQEIAAKILSSGELANFNKHLVYVKIANEFFQFVPKKGLRPKSMNFEHMIITSDGEDMIGESKRLSLNLHVGNKIEFLSYGTLWNFSQTDEATLQKVVASKILYNPYSMVLYK